MKHFSSGALSLGFVLRLWSIATAAILFPMATPMAQRVSEPNLKAEIKPDQGITIGDILTLTLTASFPKGWSVRLPGMGEKVGEFQVRESRTAPSTPQGDGWQQQLVARLTAYRTGTFEIPAFRAEFLGPQNRKLEISSNAIPVEVVSVITDKSPELKDLKPQAELPESYLWLWIGSALVLAAAALAYYLRKRMARRQRGGEPAAASVPLPPPHEEARRALEVLLARNLLASGRAKQFYFELSEIVRRMVGRQYRVVTLERTTGEIVEELRNVRHEPVSAGALEDFLNRCDLIKFAKYQPKPPEQEELLQMARSFIEDVRQAYLADRTLETSATFLKSAAEKR